MKKIVSIPSIIFICLAWTFISCKSNQTTEETTTTESKTVNADSMAIAKELNKYLIVPPDSDYTGDYVDKYPSGVIKFSGYFRFGKRHGQWLAFYEDGVKWSECFYDKGKKHGASNVYYPNGKLKYSGWYKNDLRDSIWLFFDEQGKEIDKHAFRDDVETGLVN